MQDIANALAVAVREVNALRARVAELTEDKSEASPCNDCALHARVKDLEEGIKSALSLIPGAIRVHEGGGPEDLLASLAVTAATLNRK